MAGGCGAGLLGGPRRLTRLRAAMRVDRYRRRSEEAYVGWARRFVRFCEMRHPLEVGERDVERFLAGLAVDGGVSASTQTQALSALVFLYDGRVRSAARPVRRPGSSKAVRAPSGGIDAGRSVGGTARDAWYAGASGGAAVRVRAAAARGEIGRAHV